jgi:hypothetical protein
MNDAFKTIFKDKIILWTTLLSLFLLIAVAIYIAIVYPQLPPILPLFNRMSWGYSRLGDKILLLIPLSITILFCTINLFATALVYNRVVLISRMISAISFTLVLCTSIYIVKIIQLVL